MFAATFCCLERGGAVELLGLACTPALRTLGPGWSDVAFASIRDTGEGAERSQSVAMQSRVSCGALRIPVWRGAYLGSFLVLGDDLGRVLGASDTCSVR